MDGGSDELPVTISVGIIWFRLEGGIEPEVSGSVGGVNRVVRCIQSIADALAWVGDHAICTRVSEKPLTLVATDREWEEGEVARNKREDLARLGGHSDAETKSEGLMLSNEYLYRNSRIRLA